MAYHDVWHQYFPECNSKGEPKGIREQQHRTSWGNKCDCRRHATGFPDRGLLHKWLPHWFADRQLQPATTVPSEATWSLQARTSLMHYYSVSHMKRHGLTNNTRSRCAVENEENEHQNSNNIITGMQFRKGINSLTGCNIFMIGMS